MYSASTSILSSKTKLRLFLLWFALCVAERLAGEEPGIGVRLAEDAKIQARARSAASAVLISRNDGEKDRQFILEAGLPESWRAVQPHTGVLLPAASTNIHLVSFFLPHDVRAGEYRLFYRLLDPFSRIKVAECSITVSVAAEPSLEMRILEKPSFVIAGESYEILCAVSNTGNTELALRLSVDGGSEYRYELLGLDEAGRGSLPVGGILQFSVVVETSGTLTRLQKDRAQIRVFLEEPSPSAGLAAGSAAGPPAEPLSALSYAVDVLPQSLDMRQLVLTLPLDFLTEAEARYAEGLSGRFAETLKAKGAIDESGKRFLELSLHKKLDYGGDSWIYDPEDRYSLKMLGPSGELKLGDEAYGLSPLLRGGYGRGGEALLELKPFRFGALYYRSIWGEEDREFAGASADFSIPAPGRGGDFVYRAAFNLFSPFDAKPSYGFFQQVRPSAASELEADLAFQEDEGGGLSQALYASTTGSWEFLSWDGRFLRAWPGFEGSFQDTQLLQSRLGLRFWGGGLNLNAGLSIAEKNLDLDEALSTADRTAQYSLGLGASLPEGKTKFGLGWDNWRSLDRLPGQRYDNKSDILKLEAGQRFGAFGASLKTRLEYGREAIDETFFIAHENSIALDYQISDQASYTATLKNIGRVEGGGKGSNSPGLTIDARYSGRDSRFSWRFSNANLFAEEGWKQSQLGLLLKYSRIFSNRHVFSALIEGTVAASAWELRPSALVSLSYRLPLDLPIGRKKDSAIVSGRVFDQESGKALSGILLRLNGTVAVTNAAGEYSFFLPRSGRSYLQIDRSSLPANMISSIGLPFEVNTRDKRDQVIDIGMIESSTLRGSVRLYELAAGSGIFSPEGEGSAEEESRVLAGGLGNLLLELSNGQESRRKLTNQNGAFLFSELRPGHYRLKIIGGAIPLYHKVSPEEMELELGLGEEREVEFQVLQERRPIRILESLGDLVLETPGASEGGPILVEEGGVAPPPQENLISPLLPEKPPEAAPEPETLIVSEAVLGVADTEGELE